MFLALLSSCDLGDQIVMTSVTSSTIAWMRLNKHYTNKSHNHIKSLKKCLSFVTKDTSSINSYLHSILLIANKISLIGHPIDDLDLVIIALNGLSPSFREFTTIIRTKDTFLLFDECSNSRIVSNFIGKCIESLK